jgi:opacity protein-like surface antigen
MVLYATFTPSQLQAQAYWKVGFKGGFNEAKIVGEPDTLALFVEDVVDARKKKPTENRLGFVGGIDVTYQWKDYMGFRLEGLYSRKGFKSWFGGTFKQNTVDDSTFVEVAMDYFEIPILAVGSYRVMDNLKINAMAGPSFGFHVRTNYTADKLEDEGPLDDAIKSTEFSLILGVGVEWELQDRSILLEGRWTRGLTNVDDSKYNQEYFNSCLSLIAGVSISSSP